MDDDGNRTDGPRFAGLFQRITDTNFSLQEFDESKFKTMADYDAVSTNLMHEDIRVTDSIYTRLTHDEVKQRVAGQTTSVKPTQVADRSSGVSRRWPKLR